MNKLEAWRRIQQTMNNLTKSFKCNNLLIRFEFPQQKEKNTELVGLKKDPERKKISTTAIKSQE